MSAAIGTPPAQLPAAEPLVFISSFAGGGEGGIAAFHWNEQAGKLTPATRTGNLENPFFLAISPDHRFLFSIHAIQFGSADPEHVAAFRIVDRTGKLEPLNRQSTHGSASCSLDVDASGRTLLVANYTTGNIAALPIHADGELGAAATIIQHVGSSVNKERQDGPRAHCILASPDNRYVFVADLGLDKILSYALDPTSAKLTPHRQAFVRSLPGAGPRHIAFHPHGKQLYAINELISSVTHYDYDASTGYLFEKQTLSTLPDGYAEPSYCADLKITPNGRFLYGTNRGHHSLATFEIAADGALNLLDIVPSRGDGPQNLLITPSGRWLLCANMPGNNVAVFQIDAQSGKIAPHGEPTPLTSPSCIMWVP